MSASTLATLSNDIAATIERAAAGVVAVEARRRMGSSGFYLRPHLIVTADHALESDDVEIVSAGGTAEAGTIVGRDPSTDLALVRTASAGSPLTAGAPEDVRTGAIVLAVARDDDGDVAATMGVISATGAAWRTWHGGEIDRFIRPDLSLYPRFSGSPLIGADGAFIGLNTSGLSRRHALTVPATTIERVVAALLERGRIPRGYLGVALQPVRLPRALGGGDAAVIVGVEPGGPAERAGLILGDVIVGAGGTATDLEDLHGIIGGTAAGTALAFDVLRGGERRRVDATVAERPDREDA